MQFKEWLLTEMAWVGFQKMDINGVPCDGIDFRLEDARKGSNPAIERGGTSPEPFDGTQFMNSPFSAPLTSGWLNYDGHALDTTDEPRYPKRLPESWFYYAQLTDGNQIVKPPEWPRGKVEVHGRKDLPPMSSQQVVRKNRPTQAIQPTQPIFTQ